MNSEEFANIEMKKRLGGTKCPLPRIGGKEWGWEYSFYSTGLFTSPMTKYQVCLIDQKWCVVCLGLSGEPRFLASGDSSIVTKRIAELLTRRDWRREQRRGEQRIARSLGLTTTEE